MTTRVQTTASDHPQESDADDRPLAELPCRLGEFQVESLLGDGGPSCVYRATRLADGHQVALKILKPSTFEDGSEERQIEEHGCGHLDSEFQIGSQFEHPNVARILALHSDSDVPHLEMELSSPVTFHDFILGTENRHYQDLVPHFSHYVTQMAAALQHLHQKGWVHGDVKPGNFLVDEQHHVTLIDFSYAQPLPVDGKLQRPLNVSGTNGYMSPEQRHRWPMDERSDIYSLGRTLYVMLTRQFPYVERQDMTSKQLRETPVTPDAHRVNPNVSQEFADLLIAMMEEDPVNRPASIGEVLDRFRKVQPFSR